MYVRGKNKNVIVNDFFFNLIFAVDVTSSELLRITNIGFLEKPIKTYWFPCIIDHNKKN